MLTQTGWYWQVTNGVIDVSFGKRAKGQIPGGTDGASDESLWGIGWAAEWVDTPPRPGKYYDPKEGQLTHNDVVSPPRIERVDTWVAKDESDIVALLENQITAQVNEAEKTKIERLADPALLGIMEEAVAAAEAAKNRLAETTDYENFDPALNPADVNSVQMARALSIQEFALADDPAMSPTQAGELTDAAAEHQAIVLAGDPAADVPDPPVFARRFIGVPGEDYGTLEAVRVANPNDGSQWTLTFRLTFDRQLDLTDHWIAIYDETAPLDEIPDGSTGYRTTPFLTETSPGVYEADMAAVADWGPEQVERRVTLCNGHITNPVLALMVIPATSNAERFRVRYGGNISAGGGTWTDTGVQVTGIVGGGVYNVSDTAPFDSLAADTPVRIDGVETTFQTVHTTGAPGIITVGDHNASAVGHNVWIAG